MFIACLLEFVLWFQVGFAAIRRHAFSISVVVSANQESIANFWCLLPDLQAAFFVCRVGMVRKRDLFIDLCPFLLVDLSGDQLPCTGPCSLCSSPTSSLLAMQTGRNMSERDRRLTWGARMRQEEIFINKSPRKKDFIFLIEEFITIVLLNITPAHQAAYVTCQLCLSCSKMKD